MRIALAGNPNSGKTTMYNALTGRNEKVGNWAGVTVDVKVHPIKKKFYTGDRELLAVDLPGAYSMSPFTSEESITRDYVQNAKPDVIINIVDATNISRSLFFTTQLLELGIPVVVALNKSDINEKKQTIIDNNALSEALGCKVVNTVSLDGEGLDQLIATAVSLVGQGQTAPYSGGDVDLNDREAVKAADVKRFEFVKSVVSKVEERKVFTKDRSIDDKIDNILTNKWLGIPIFGVVMFLVFGVSQAWVGPLIADALVGLIEIFQGWVGGLFEEGALLGNAHPIFPALLVDGIIGGVGAVIGFLPLVMVMYFLIAMLEECGYMSRVAVVLDPIFKKVGLSGKSVIPFVITVGCAIPGVMASRTIKNERERRATAMLSPFMPCGAKLPVISLFAGVFFDNSWIVSALMYFAGIALIFFGAFVVNKIAGYRAKKSYFIIELPEYKAPSFKHAWNTMLSRGWSYIVKAGTIILICNTAVQLMQSFNWRFELVEEGMEHTSILAGIATPFAFLLIPLGFGVWQMAAAAITGFIAKENVVGTIAVCYGITNFINVDELVLESGAAEVAAIFGITKAAALACLMFNLFTPPCFAAIGAMNAEIKDKKWFFGGIGLQFATGYTVAFLVYQLGTLFTTGSLGQGFFPGLAAVAVMIGIIVFLAVKAKAQDKVEYTLE